jgi:hypothetical protein
VKDFLGAIGPILIALPWYSDFLQRRKSTALSELPLGGRLRLIRNDIVSSIKRRLKEPKVGDVVWTTVGLACICASFLVAFFCGMRDLF